MRTMTVLAACLLISAAATVRSAAADIHVQAGDVKDTRTTEKFFAGLEVHLKFLGDDLDGAKSVNCTVTKAVDDTGRDLIKEEKDRSQSSAGENCDDSGRAEITVQLKNPARKATMVRELAGDVVVFKPSNDPTATITFSNVNVKTGLVLAHPTLAANQIKAAVLSKEQYEKKAKEAEQGADARNGMEKMGEGMAQAFAGMFSGMAAPGGNSVILEVADPQAKLVSIEFLDAAGKPARSQSTMTMGAFRIYEFENPLPPTTRLRLFVATPQAMFHAPFALSNLILP